MGKGREWRTESSNSSYGRGPPKEIYGALDGSHWGLRTVDCSPAGKELSEQMPYLSFSLLLVPLTGQTQMETRGKNPRWSSPQMPSSQDKEARESGEAGPDVRFCVKESCVTKIFMITCNRRGLALFKILKFSINAWIE